MGKIITFANQKGGVGKTTTAFAFLTELSRKKFNVLGVDFDPSGNFSRSMNSNSGEGIFADVFKGTVTIENAIEQLKYGDFIASDIFLSSVERESSDNLNRQFLLKEMLQKVSSSYDYILIDTPPSLGFFTINAFVASDEIIIPTTPNTFAIDGMIALNDTVDMVKKYSNQNLGYNGAILTKFKSRTRAGKDLKDVTEKVGEKFNLPIYKQTVRDSTVIEDSYIGGRSFYDYDKNAPVSKDYTEVVKEFLEKEKINEKK